MTTYELQYCESRYYPSVDGGFYGGLTICKEEFDSYSKMYDYIERNKIMWTENPNWSNMKYIIIKRQPKQVEYLYNQKQREFVYDFRKPRVKETTKYLDSGTERTEVMEKFSMGYLIEGNGDFYFGIGVTISNSYRYEEVKQRLLELLETKKFENVTIIK